MGIGVILPIIITVGGVYFLIRLRAFFLLHPIKTLKLTLSSFSDNPKSSIKSLSLALAGTLGVGNITGVAIGIILGGAGSVFWLLVSSVFAASLKYAESVLAIDNMDSTAASRGGMMYLIKTTFGKASTALSYLYAASCLLLALFMGGALQSNTVKMTLDFASSIPPVAVVAFTVILTALLVKGGGEKIEKITVILIPLATVVYILMSFCIIFSHQDRILEVIRLIIGSAFSPLSLGGGIVGFISSRCVFEGYARGILSNEAGAGTSTLAHARNKGTTPCREGALGMCEVLFDTVILCMLTAFSILLSVDAPCEYSSAMALLCDAFSSVLGGAFCAPLIISILIFAFSTIICWYYYGEECAQFLIGGRGRVQFYIAYILFVALGMILDVLFIVRITDLLLLLLSVLTVATLIKNSDRVRTLSELEKVISKREFSKAPSRRMR